MVTESTVETAYRLVGEVEGENRSYPLQEGTNSVGFAGAAVALRARGVSRNHAVLEVRGGAVALTDNGSKNGSFVNGQRVERTALRKGDELRFGPVRLRLEETHADDNRLALSLTPLPEGGSSFGGDTSILLQESVGGRDLSLLRRLLSFLEVRPEADLQGALDWLTKALEARAGALVETLPGAAPSVIAAAGTLGPLPELPAPAPDLDSEGRPPVLVYRGRELTTAVIRHRGGTLGGLLLWIEPPSPASNDLLGIVLRLLLLFHRPAPAEAPPRRRGAGLDFPPGIVASGSPEMASLYQQMILVRDASRPVLILGETGVGKEHLAKTLHRSSRRREGPFIAVNCSALPPELLEAEMFGVGKGVATGVRQRDGKFLEADGGTLFLDEIGEMPLPLQAKLLRVLQERQIEPLGGSPTRVDVQVVSATNSDTQALLDEGRFRRDLYFRLAGFVLQVPPLRQRKEDLPELVAHFLRQACAESGKSVRGITVRALQALQAYPWPGNVRELEHEIHRLVYLCPQGQVLDSSALSPAILEGAAAGGGPAQEDTGSVSTEGDGDEAVGDGLEAQVEALERRLIRDALVRTGGNRSRAATLLRISRNGLFTRMRRLGLAIEDFDPLRS